MGLSGVRHNGRAGSREEGAESIHAEFNAIEQGHKNQRHDRVERLCRGVVEHLTESSQQNVAAQPPTKRWKVEE